MHAGRNTEKSASPLLKELPMFRNGVPRIEKVNARSVLPCYGLFAEGMFRNELADLKLQP
jgi:hypothetical protein